jgi:hypothetical protein
MLAEFFQQFNAFTPIFVQVPLRKVCNSFSAPSGFYARSLPPTQLNWAISQLSK